MTFTDAVNISSFNSALSDISHLNGVNGWFTIRNTTYTSESPLNVSGGVTQVIPLDTTGIDTYLPSGLIGDYFDTSTYKFTPQKAGEVWVIRINMVMVPAQNDTDFDYSIDIGGSEGNIITLSENINKGIGSSYKVNETDLVFCLGTFVSNGGEFKVTPTKEVDISGISLVAARIYCT